MVTAEEIIAASGVPLSILVLVFGLLVGSFLNVVIARVPKGESIVHPRSRCPHCGYMIPSWLNVPVLSWLVLRGRCWSCKTAISVRYPIVELLTGVLFLGCFRQFGLTWALLAGMILSASLLAITFIDIDVFEIPDEISIPGILLGIVLRPIAFDVPWYSGLAAAALAITALLGLRWGYASIRGIEGMGLGDVKLLAMIGAFLGPGALLPVLLVASMAGLVVGGPLVLMARRNAEDDEAEDEAEAPEGPVKIRLALRVRIGGRRWGLGAKDVPTTRTHVRAAIVGGGRRPGKPPFSFLFGLVHDEPGWGAFDGFTRGLEYRAWPKGGKVWLGVMAGYKEDPREYEDEDEEWEAPKEWIPFGPFLALGALFTLLFGHNFQRWLFMLTA